MSSPIHSNFLRNLPQVINLFVSLQKKGGSSGKSRGEQWPLCPPPLNTRAGNAWLNKSTYKFQGLPLCLPLSLSSLPSLFFSAYSTLSVSLFTYLFSLYLSFSLFFSLYLSFFLFFSISLSTTPIQYLKLKQLEAFTTYRNAECFIKKIFKHFLVKFKL